MTTLLGVFGGRPTLLMHGHHPAHHEVRPERADIFLLDRLALHEDKVNTSITLPSYIGDVAKVRMWCAWAEIVLGEASFAKPLPLK